MSANNWRICPQCKAKALAEWEARKQAARKAYGKVPSEKYEQMTAAARDEPELEDSLREDYQIGITEKDEFYVIYRGSCQVCSFEHRFRHKQQLSITTMEE